MHLQFISAFSEQHSYNQHNKKCAFVQGLKGTSHTVYVSVGLSGRVTDCLGTYC